MKKSILIIGLTGLLGLSTGLTSCAPDYETDFNVYTLVVPDRSQAPIIFSLEGGTQSITVETNVALANWKASSNAEWCHLTKSEGKVTVTVDENNIYKQRLAEITIAYGHQSYSIAVSQFGLEPKILVGDKLQQEGYIKDAEATATHLTIPVATNLELDNIVIPDTCNWIRLQEEPVDKTRTEGDTNKQDLVFNLDQNTDTVVRYCTVILQSSQNYSYAASFVIKQQASGYIIEIDDAAKTFEIPTAGSTITIPFKVNGPTKAYTYEIEESAKNWIIPVKAAATRAMRDAYETFDIQTSIELVPRVGYITFRSTDPKNPNEFRVTINQKAFNPVPPVNVMNATATPGDGFITLNWDMPEDRDYTSIKIFYYDKVRQKERLIEINNKEATSQIVKGTYLCAEEYSFTIKTYGPTGMETLTPITVTGTSKVSPRSILETLTLDMLSANATHPTDGQGLAGLIDGNIDTYYHSQWEILSPGSKPHYVQINMSKEPIQYLRFEYDARNNQVNNDGDPKIVGIWGSDTGTDGSFVLIDKETFTLPTTKGGHAVPDKDVSATKSYKYIRFIPESRRSGVLDASNTTKAWWNMANLYLYRINYEDENWAKKELGI